MGHAIHNRDPSGSRRQGEVQAEARPQAEGPQEEQEDHGRRGPRLNTPPCPHATRAQYVVAPFRSRALLPEPMRWELGCRRFLGRARAEAMQKAIKEAVASMVANTANGQPATPAAPAASGV